MDIILLAGLWLRNTVWDDVAAGLARRGHRPMAPPLPGVDDASPTAAGALAWIVADRRPDAVAQVALVGGFPVGDGGTYADFLEIADGVMPFELPELAAASKVSYLNVDSGHWPMVSCPDTLAGLLDRAAPGRAEVP